MFIILALATWTLCFLGFLLAQNKIPLLPEGNSDIQWSSSFQSPSSTGETRLSVRREDEVIDYSFTLSSEEQYPYAAYSFNFYEQANQPVDLTRYDTLHFKVTCEPQNVLLFVLFTHDQRVTDPKNEPSQRVNSTFFSCDATWQSVQIDLRRLTTPDWWLAQFGLEYSKQQYDLEQVYRFSIVNSLQSPRSTLSRVKITGVEFGDKQTVYVYLIGALVICCWIMGAIWLFRRYVRRLLMDVKAQVDKGRPFIAYKALSIAPQKEKAKDTLLHHMAIEYANPDLSLEVTAALLGINRNKVNDILKEELGVTFSTCINKLRLTEAARLLSENQNASISEIAYSVGYNNVSYFNRLFKSENGCTPKDFQQNVSVQTGLDHNEIKFV